MADALPVEQLFFDLTEEEVLAIRASALRMVTEGKTLMKVSAGGKDGEKQFPMSPAKVLKECRAALRHINPTVYGRRRRKSYGIILRCD